MNLLPLSLINARQLGIGLFVIGLIAAWAFSRTEQARRTTQTLRDAELYDQDRDDIYGWHPHRDEVA